jgi:hypothetical protein
VGDRSRGRFATPADQPRHDCSPYSHMHTYGASIWDVPILQGPREVARAKPYVRFATFASLYDACPAGVTGRAGVECAVAVCEEGGTLRWRMDWSSKSASSWHRHHPWPVAMLHHGGPTA